MDWKALLQQTTEKAKTLGSQVLTQGQILAKKAQDAISIVTLAQWDALKGEKRIIIFAGSASSAFYKESLLKMPVYQTKAWINSTKLVLVDSSLLESKDLIEHLQITANPTILGYRDGTLIDRKETETDIRTYLDACLVSKPVV